MAGRFSVAFPTFAARRSVEWSKETKRTKETIHYGQGEITGRYFEPHRRNNEINRRKVVLIASGTGRPGVNGAPATHRFRHAA
jgi:hypothetical protein